MLKWWWHKWVVSRIFNRYRKSVSEEKLLFGENFNAVTGGCKWFCLDPDPRNF
jgi:hypothetical protein